MSSKRPKILITNDDGIYAPGIKHLWTSLHEVDIGDLSIIAPLTERSGTGLSITSDRPLLVQNIKWPEKTPAWSVDGTPADCVKMGMQVILNHKPDFIFSGINAGSNAGRNVLYSGTIGAVIEGVLNGIPGIAFSCENIKSPNYTLAIKYIAPLLHYLMKYPLPKGCLLNVNFPHNVKDKVKGFRLARQGKGRWAENPQLHLKVEEGLIYWLGNRAEELVEEEDSDVELLKQGYITVVPLHVEELTIKDEIHIRKSDFQKFFCDY
ncbi:MAG: 5'/3'-nucleotidase SurE [Chlamydiales bacterium]